MLVYAADHFFYMHRVIWDISEKFVQWIVWKIHQPSLALPFIHTQQFDDKDTAEIVRFAWIDNCVVDVAAGLS